MTTQMVACFLCGRFQGDRKCEAFPDGIPDSIWTGDDHHETPVAGDNGLVFEVGKPEPGKK